jgi:hypothetical protein
MSITAAQCLTLGFVLATTAAVLGYDLWVIRGHGPDASISRVVARVLAAWPTLFVALVFWLDVLVGHVWLPAR